MLRATYKAKLRPMPKAKLKTILKASVAPENAKAMTTTMLEATRQAVACYGALLSFFCNALAR